jgi:hypothetical protein
MRLPADVIVQLMEVVDRCLDTLVRLLSSTPTPCWEAVIGPIHPSSSALPRAGAPIRADFHSSRQIDESISNSNFFPPNRGFDFYCCFLPAESRSRFLLPISSRQIEESISIADFIPLTG